MLQTHDEVLVNEHCDVIYEVVFRLISTSFHSCHDLMVPVDSAASAAIWALRKQLRLPLKKFLL
jgi:hypothetical protein